jgi:predicted nucleic acid-binding protein
MAEIGVFVDTSMVNKMLSINEERPNDPTHEEDRAYLGLIIQQYAETGKVRLWVNPTVQYEIEKTPSLEERCRLQEQLKKFRFTSFSTTVFPIVFGPDGATFLTDQQKEKLETLYQDIPKYKQDEKVFADAAFNSSIQFLLTGDRNHLAKKRFRDRVQELGLHKEVRVFTPKELFEYLRSLDCDGH